LTLKHKDFLYDSGAHRFHDKNAPMTQELKNLLGDELREIQVPSQIYNSGAYIDFPLTPLDLMSKLGVPTLVKGAIDLIKARMSRRSPQEDFEGFAVHTYGKTIAELFLLGYTRKLWGIPPSKLSPVTSGGRLKGLTISTFLHETFGGNKRKTKHLDGSFYYPRQGIHVIPKRLAEVCGNGHILTDSRITRIFHDYDKIRAIEVNGRDRIETSRVVNTLPLSFFLDLLEPQPPLEIVALAKSLRYRDLLLIAYFLKTPSVSKNASIYFPDPRFPFARAYEPKNRSAWMAPPDKTALIVEWPCQRDDQAWNTTDGELVNAARSHLVRIGLIKKVDILDEVVTRMEYAYPVIEKETEEKKRRIFRFLRGFENLKSSGRGALFEYIHIHDIMRISEEIMEGLARA
jgi:protoporphyrinogen oxidase